MNSYRIIPHELDVGVNRIKVSAEAVVLSVAPNFKIFVREPSGLEPEYYETTTLIVTVVATADEFSLHEDQFVGTMVNPFYYSFHVFYRKEKS